MDRLCEVNCLLVLICTVISRVFLETRTSEEKMLKDVVPDSKLVDEGSQCTSPCCFLLRTERCVVRAALSKQYNVRIMNS